MRSGIALISAGGVLLLASAAPLLAIGSASAADAPGSGLGSYGMSAVAHGVQLTVGEPSYCFTTPSGTNGCEGDVPQAESELANGPLGSATAAVAWPGSLAANLGSLLITAGGSQVPPQATSLNDPVKAMVLTGATPDTVVNDSVPGVHMKAVAKATETSSDARVSSLSASAAGTFGPISGQTSTALKGASSAVATATANASDIDLAAGVVHIGSVQSTVTATSDGKKGIAKGSTKVAGATVAGVPVTIDDKGVSVSGSGVGLKALTDQVNSALTQAGIIIRLSDPQTTLEGASAFYSSGSLVVSFKQMGYSLTAVLGNASASVTSQPALTFSQPPPVTGGTTGGTSGGSTTGVIDPTTGGTSGGGTSGGIVPIETTGGTVPTTTTGGIAPSFPQPVLSAQHAKLGGGLSPWLALPALFGTTLIAFGMKRLPDRVLEAVPPVCPLEEN